MRTRANWPGRKPASLGTVTRTSTVPVFASTDGLTNETLPVAVGFIGAVGEKFGGLPGLETRGLVSRERWP